MERLLATTLTNEQPLEQTSLRERAYKVIDILLIIGIILKMATLAIMLIEALNKWRQDSHSRKWPTMIIMLFALLLVSARLLILQGCFHRYFRIFTVMDCALPGWPDLEQCAVDGGLFDDSKDLFGRSTGCTKELQRRQVASTGFQLS